MCFFVLYNTWLFQSSRNEGTFIVWYFQHYYIKIYKKKKNHITLVKRKIYSLHKIHLKRLKMFNISRMCILKSQLKKSSSYFFQFRNILHFICWPLCILTVKLSLTFEEELEPCLQSQSSGGVLQKSVLKDFRKFTGKCLCQSLFFDITEGLRHATLLKKRLWNRCFPVNFEKFLRAPLFNRTHLDQRFLLLY